MRHGKFYASFTTGLYLVVLQIPTFDLLVFTAGEQVGATAADRHATDRADVSSQRELELPTGQVPDL